MQMKQTKQAGERTQLTHKQAGPKYVTVTVSQSGKSFVLAETTRPHTIKGGGEQWEVKGAIIRGQSPRALADEARKMGFNLHHAPTEKSRFAMHGDDVRDWEGNVIGKYSEGGMTAKLNRR